MIIFLTVVSAVPGCNESITTKQIENPGQFFRFAVGNRWTYVDSVISEGGISVDTFTVAVESVRTEGGTNWWTLRNRFNPSIAASEFMIKNDSVYSLQYTESSHGLAPIVSLEYIRPQPSDTSIYTSLFDGDVTLIKSATLLHHPYSVPAGTFSGCASYKYQIYPEHYHEILAPGVGILSCEILVEPSFDGAGWRRAMKLLDYKLVDYRTW